MTAPSVDRILLRTLAEYAENDLAYIQVCKGDVTISISTSGAFDVATENNLSCNCDPGFRAVVGALSG